MKMVLQTLLLIVFGQTDAANLDEADNNQIKNAKAKVFVADIVDRNNKIVINIEMMLKREEKKEKNELLLIILIREMMMTVIMMRRKW